VAGVQHPAPTLLCVVNSAPATVSVSAPYATPVFAGRNLLPPSLRTQLWALLYTQVTQADGASHRNVLLGRLRLTQKERPHGSLLPAGVAGATWPRGGIEAILKALALPADSPLSVIVVETLEDIGSLADPMGVTLAMCASCAHHH
jgi:hypothetical protein